MDYDRQYPKMTSNCLYNLVPASPLTLLSATQLILVSLDLSQSSFLFVVFLLSPLRFCLMFLLPLLMLSPSFSPMPYFLQFKVTAGISLQKDLLFFVNKLCLHITFPLHLAFFHSLTFIGK